MDPKSGFHFWVRCSRSGPERPGLPSTGERRNLICSTKRRSQMSPIRGAARSIRRSGMVPSPLSGRGRILAGIPEPLGRTPGEWSHADLFAVAAITLGIAFQIKSPPTCCRSNLDPHALQPIGPDLPGRPRPRRDGGCRRHLRRSRRHRRHRLEELSPAPAGRRRRKPPTGHDARQSPPMEPSFATRVLSVAPWPAPGIDGPPASLPRIRERRPLISGGSHGARSEGRSRDPQPFRGR